MNKYQLPQIYLLKHITLMMNCLRVAKSILIAQTHIWTIALVLIALLLIALVLIALVLIALHYVYIRDYLFLRTEQAGTYFKICHLLYPYLIFVIFFTQARFLENKIYTEERVNYDKWILRQNSVNRDLLGQANYKDQDYTKFVTHCV